MRQTLILHNFNRITFDDRDPSLLPLRFEMSSLKEMQTIDRELSSELVESPINPAFLRMSTPSRGECNPMNGEALWQWRKLSGDPNKVFDALQGNLLKIGYKLSSSSSVRVGIAVNSRIGYIVKKIRNVTSGKDRYAIRSGYLVQRWGSSRGNCSRTYRSHQRAEKERGRTDN